ncbi:hydroxyproline O-galactosyltransferase HPGT1 [Impatiens glandulifera]|uniref:hydroxyproline O-galactosyltransferase HPGT1 n=1 Tax=Impatiens glandulifera TaxID=253017 RepID=UPI001FB05027|nr:hydroxyproline O-galactosyltransferase HPGT1 [Impatiens glandulifera]
MHSRPSSNRLTGPFFRSQISLLVFSMFAAMASLYVAGRLWFDSQNRVYMIKELDRRTGQGKSAISIDDTLKIIACREQLKKLTALQGDLSKAGQEGFVSKQLSENSGTQDKKRPLALIGVISSFGRQKNRDAIRKAWMHSGAALKNQDEKGIIVRFVIGRSVNKGDTNDSDIDNESRQTNDFMILNDHIENPQEEPKKMKLFFAQAVEHWDAEFFVKVNDDVYVNIDALGATLAAHLDKPRAYIGCMKSGEVFSEPTDKWFEPEWWKFGDKKT